MSTNRARQKRALAKPVESFEIDKAYRKDKRKIPTSLIEVRIEESGLTYPMVAERLGIKYSANVYKMARQKNPSFKTLKMFAWVLDLKVKDLIEE